MPIRHESGDLNILLVVLVVVIMSYSRGACELWGLWIPYRAGSFLSRYAV
jgi:hypothetical protein